MEHLGRRCKSTGRRCGHCAPSRVAKTLMPI
jgi:hypothetical protein